jgi:cysteine peptidase B
MKYTVVGLLAFVAYAAANPNRDAFEAFKVKYNRQYATAEEEQARFAIFSQNMVRMSKFNSLDVNKPYGVTKFMDVSKEEFRARYFNKVNITEGRAGGIEAEPMPPMDLPTTFDWKNQTPMCVTAVKDQGQCGSCWAFSGVETIESVSCLAGYPLTVLSEQQIVDCDTDGGVQGCNGGWPEDVYTYAQTFGGLDTETQYPYVAEDQNCQAVTTNFYKVPITSWKWVSQTKAGEANMAPFLYANSPLSIAADAESWQFYTSGVVSASGCGKQLDHAIQITGWSVLNNVPVWNVRNSWNTDWGMNGYIYLEMNKNTCGCATHVTVPCVTSKSGSTVC